MKKILILEDEQKTREVLAGIVKHIDGTAEVFAAGTVEEAYVFAMDNTIDVFILDIILKPGSKHRDSSGAEFAQNMRMVSRYHFTPIIFLTSLYDSKMNMYSSIHCYKFIEKPCDYDVVEEVIRDAMMFHTRNGKDRQYFYRNRGILEAVTIRDIIYVKSVNRDLYVTTTKERCKIPYKSLKVLRKELDTEDFLQCSRSTIVNKTYIKSIDPTNRYISLHYCDDVLEIGSILKKDFMKRFTKN